MKLRNILFIFAAITLGFASCSSESDILDEMNTPVEGLDKEETVAVSFNIGKDFQTKAESTTQEPSIKEATINNCVIAIFDHATGTILAKKEFSLNNGLIRNGNTYTTTQMTAKAIPSDVIVVANCPVGYFNNVVTKAGFDKAVQAQMGNINTLTASNLIKVWRNNDIDLGDVSNRNITVNVHQIAARVDLELNLRNESSVKDINFEITSVSVNNINKATKLFSNDSYDINKDFENATVLQNSLSADYKTISSVYSYPSNGNENQAVLKVVGKVNKENKTFIIKVEGSDKNGKLESGYLYRIQGTVVYKQANVDVELTLQYEVVPITTNNIQLPNF